MTNKLQRLKLFIWTVVIATGLIAVGVQASDASTKTTLDKAKAWALITQTQVAKIYKLESMRTAAIRTVMAATCLSDGSCNEQDMMVLLLAGASGITALTYDAMSSRRCGWLPAKLNLVADAIACLAGYDAGWLPITGSIIEIQIRTTVSYLSWFATGISWLPS
jgi:hypothetical protein